MVKVGVVMPTYNQAEFLSAAIDSYLSQDRGASRLVVVDDGSTDDTPKILDKLGPEVWTQRQENRGTAEAINAGVRNLTAGWTCSRFDALTWISSDNVMTPDWLSTLAKAMEETGAGAVYSGFVIVHPGGRRQNFFREHRREGLLEDVNCYYGPSFLIRRDVWHEAGPHRGKIAHDYDHWLRVEEACYRRRLPIVGVPRPLCYYSAHDKRATVVRRAEFDAHVWQAGAKARRGT